MEDGLIKKERMNYERLKSCFCKLDGSVFNESLKEILQQIKNDLSPKRDNIIALIKKLK